jgi:imidazolonepropionase
MSFDLLITNARVVTCAGPDDAPPKARLGIVEHGAIAIEGERIAWVGPERELAMARAKHTIDAGGRIAMPGLVDPHTHLVFAGSRVDELARRMAGEDYRAIAASGGGIAATVRWSREASDDELYALTAARAQALRAHGVTSVEIKSGYGLSTEHELRHLRVARRLETDGIVHVTTSLLGAHAVPPERKDDRAAYVEEVATAMVPLAAQEGLADACDVYLDEGAFTRAEAERVLRAAQRAGLKVRAHVGQFADLGGAELLAELGGLSCDHLEEVSDEGLRAMARAGVTAVLLPTAWRTLRQTPPSAERLRAFGVRMAVGTDCNPGTSPTVDLPLQAALAVRDAGLTLEEAVLALTVEAARAAGLPDVGRLAPGLRADVALFDEEDPRALAYGVGGPDARCVVLGGRIVVERDPSPAALW